MTRLLPEVVSALDSKRISVEGNGVKSKMASFDSRLKVFNCTCSLSLGQSAQFYLVHLCKVEVVVGETMS